MLKVNKKDILKKLSEYGITLYSEYPTEDHGHCFITKDMIIFLDEDDCSLSITFQADMKPEDVATNILILNEIDDISDISVMESFIYDKSNNFVCGNEAHKIVKSSIVEEAIQKLAKDQAYMAFLATSKCFEC